MLRSLAEKAVNATAKREGKRIADVKAATANTADPENADALTKRPR